MSEIKCVKCGKICKSLQGWKMHQSGAHGGYDDNDIAEATGIASAINDDPRARMEQFAQTLDLGDDESQQMPTAEFQPQPTAPPLPQKETERRIKATPKRLKRILGDIPGKILETQNIKLDDDDREAMEEAAEFLAGVFGVEFAVPESKYTVKSRFAAFIWVAGVTFLVYIKHKLPEIWAAFSSAKTEEEAKK